jgi:hypothetical protein
MRVYIAGPYTKGDVALNVAAAIDAADKLANAGHYPYLPHLTHFWHMLRPRPYREWLKLDAAWIPFCEAVVRLPGESTGADSECAKARLLGIPVMTLEECLAK